MRTERLGVSKCRIAYTCDAEQFEALARLAEETGAKRNDLIRRAIDDLLRGGRTPAGRDRRLKAVMAAWGGLDDAERRALAVLASSAARGGAGRRALRDRAAAEPTLPKAQVLIEHYEAAAEDAMTEGQRRESGLRAAEIEYRRARLADDMMRGRATAETAHELWDGDPEKGELYADWINESLAWCAGRFEGAV